MLGRLEVTPGDNFESFADIDNQTSGLVRDIEPLIVLPDLEARDRYRKKKRSQAKVGMAVHLETFGCFLSGFFDGTEDGMTEVAFAGC